MRIARTLAPVGYPIGLAHLLGAAASVSGRDAVAALEVELARDLGVRRAFTVCSGKAALTLVLRALAKPTARRKVIIPAYTCYSVPSAIVKAGLQVVPCDVAEGAFDYDYARLAPMLRPDVLCVLSVHLFGIAADTRRLEQLCRDAGIVVVEDAAQAFGGSSHGEMLGTIGDVGIFSFGRGKNISCGSGGAVVTRSDAIADALAREAADLRSPTLAQDVVTFVTLLLSSWLILPWLFWLPAGLPFLRLGETIFYEDFPITRLSGFQARLLRSWHTRLRALDDVRRDHADYYFSHLDVVADASQTSTSAQPARAGRGVPLLRFPVLLPDAGEKRRLLVEEDGRAIGVSSMYADTVVGISQLKGKLDETRFPRAEAIAERLVTLPTTPLVTGRDRERICRLVNRCAARGAEARIAS